MASKYRGWWITFKGGLFTADDMGQKILTAPSRVGIERAIDKEMRESSQAAVTLIESDPAIVYTRFVKVTTIVEVPETTSIEEFTDKIKHNVELFEGYYNFPSTAELFNG